MKDSEGKVRRKSKQMNSIQEKLCGNRLAKNERVAERE